MLGNNQTTKDKIYKSPTRKLIKFFERSRDNWKGKYQDLKYTVKLKNNKIRYLEKRKTQLKKRVKELEKEITQYKLKKKT